MLSRKYRLPTKSGAMVHKNASQPKAKTIHCSFMNSAPNSNNFWLKGWRSPFRLFSLVRTLNAAQVFLRHPEPLQPKLTTIYLPNKLQTPNSSVQCTTKATVPSTVTIKTSLQIEQPISMYFERKPEQPSQFEKI